MAVLNNDAERTKVSLANLFDYDKQIKDWVLAQIGEGKGIVFAKKDDFPIVGEDNVLYVDKDKIYVWSTEDNEYLSINTGAQTPSQTLEWGTF